MSPSGDAMQGGKRKLKLLKLKEAKKRKKNVTKTTQAANLNPESGDAEDFANDFLGGDVGSDGEPAPAEEAAPAGAKAKAKRRKGKGQQKSAAEFEASRSLAAAIAQRPAGDQADWLWHSFCEQAGASPLERGGLTAAAMAPLPPAATLEEQLKAVEPDWWNEFASVAGKPPGKPSLLMVSPSAMGAVHMIKACPGFNRACRVAKLFAKHFKVAEQEAALRSDRACAAAGTPHRLCALADSGALNLDGLKWIVIDVHMDAKARTILDIPEVRADWWALWAKHLEARVAGGQARVALFCGHGGGKE